MQAAKMLNWIASLHMLLGILAAIAGR